MPAAPRLPVAAATCAALACVALTAGCGASAPSPGGGAAAPAPPATAGATTTSPPPTTPATATPPTSAVYAPTLPEASAMAAVERLMATWDAHDPGSAAAVAVPAAVTSLFAVAPRDLQFRGCSDGQPPVTCSYADRSAGGDFYEMTASEASDGRWYVSGVQLTPLA